MPSELEGDFLYGQIQSKRTGEYSVIFISTCFNVAKRYTINSITSVATSTKTVLA